MDVGVEAYFFLNIANMQADSFEPVEGKPTILHVHFKADSLKFCWPLDIHV